MEMTMVEAQKPSSGAQAFGDRVANKLFEGRTGHGGGPCSYRNLRREEISTLAATAYHLGWTQCSQAIERTTSPGEDGLTARERSMLTELRACKDLLQGVLPHAPRIRDIVTDRLLNVEEVLVLVGAPAERK
jgi:hypothetical protein